MMTFNKATFLKAYEQFFGKQTDIAPLCAQVEKTIEDIKTLTDLAADLKEIAIEALNGVITTLRQGYRPHGLTKEQLKKAVAVLENLVKLASKSEEEKKTVEWLAQALRYCIDQNNNIPTGHHSQYGRRGY